MLILPLTASSSKDIPDLNEYHFVLDTRSAYPMRFFEMYITGEMWQNLKQLLKRMHDKRTIKENYGI